MRIYVKVFIAAFLVFLVLFGSLGYFFINRVNHAVVVKSAGTIEPRAEETKITDEDRTDLSVMTKKSARVNILFLATNGDLADMMMVVSYDPTRKLVDIVSVPRDTYNKVPGYTTPGKLKMNYVFKMKGNLGGADGVRTQLEKTLKIPINYYVYLDFDAVREFVDIIGGVEVNIPKHLKYDDLYDTPPLHIDLKAGQQVLDGEKSVKFLRWRKNNDGYGESDIQRIERQHKFVKDAILKSIGPRLPQIIGSMMTYVKTDMDLKEMIHYAGTAVGMDQSQVRAYRIPGTTANMMELSYFVHNPKDTEKMMLAIYNRMGTEAPIKETITGLKQLDPNAVESKTELPFAEDKSLKKVNADPKKAQKNKKTGNTVTEPTPETSVKSQGDENSETENTDLGTSEAKSSKPDEMDP